MIHNRLRKKLDNRSRFSWCIVLWKVRWWKMEMLSRGRMIQWIYLGQRRGSTECRCEASTLFFQPLNQLRLPKITSQEVKRLMARYTVVFFVCFVSSMALGWPFTREANRLFDCHCHEAFDLRLLRNEPTIYAWGQFADWISYLTYFCDFR